MDIVKNPVILGLVAGVLTYMYMTWNKKDDKKDKKKGKKDKNNQYVGLIIPAVVAVITWFIAYGYFEYSKTNVSDNASSGVQLPNIPGYKLVKDVSSSDQIRSFSLINKGVKIPSKLPDVFIETF